MRVQIYQINHKRDTESAKFMPLKEDEVPNPAIYDEVFDAEIEESDPEAIYRRFNTEGHPLHRGHSLSVSDVVVLDGKAHLCQDIGFREVPFDASQTQKPGKLMRVVYVEPGKPPYAAEILHRLEAEQKAVGGRIEVAYNQDGTCLVCNEEGKLIGMEANRRIGDGTSIVVGPFFICGHARYDFRSLTDEETTKYLERFAEPEQITPEEVQRDSGYIFYSL